MVYVFVYNGGARKVMKMISMNATDVRKEFSAVVDKAVREKPVFITRTRDNLFLADIGFLAALVDKYCLTAQRFAEDDGSITLALDQVDIAVSAPTQEEAMAALISDLREYALDYYDHYATWSVAPNRKDHLPYVIKVLIEDDTQKIGAMIACRDGQS